MTIDSFQVSCPLPSMQHEYILLGHGSGGTLTQQLLDTVIVPTLNTGQLEHSQDAATLQELTGQLAFTTDSYVVKPFRFPGGDIGKLAINGTVNDLAMCGAIPRYLSVGLILEEGLAIADLHEVLLSMRKSAIQAGVQLVTGDTKVVDRGSGDSIFINTSGVGVVHSNASVHPSNIQVGDAVIVSGDIGRHGMAIMAARENLQVDGIVSDSCAVHHAVIALLDAGINVHCLRDPTRGGLATTLVELATGAGINIEIDETLFPITEQARGLCEILGLDPVYVANEGCFVAFVPADEVESTLAVLRQHSFCDAAVQIGRVTASGSGSVIAKTAIGGDRVLDRLSGDQLPRIC